MPRFLKTRIFGRPPATTATTTTTTTVDADNDNHKGHEGTPMKESSSLHRHKNAAASTITTTSSNNNNVVTPNSVNTTQTTLEETPYRSRTEKDNYDDENASHASSSGSEQPWDVQRSLSEDAASSSHGGGAGSASASASASVDGGKDQSNQVPSPTMKRKIQQRMNHIRQEESIEVLADGSPPKMLSSGRRSVRPLNPPAEGGGNDIVMRAKRLRAFRSSEDDTRDTSLLDDDPNNNTTNNKEKDNESPSNSEPALDEMPMDERMDYQKRKGMLCGIGGDGEDDDDDDGEYYHDEREDDGGDNLCDMTLSALGDICGTSPKAESPEKKPYGSSNSTDVPSDSSNTNVGTSKTATARALMATLPRMKPPYGVEEQTAIEVEYIEPERRQDAKSDVSTSSGGADPRKKNLLVQAMARRAKQDFERQKGRPAQVSSPTRDMDNNNNNKSVDSVEMERSQLKPPDNVYSSFSSSEKRKFLKLINNGLTPSDATDQVLNERQEAQEEHGQEEIPSSHDGKSFLKRLTEAASPSPSNKDKYKEMDGDAMVDTTEQFPKSGINYYDAVRKEQSADEDDGPEGMAPTTTDRSSPAHSAEKKSKNKRLSRLAKFGFSRLKSKQVGEEDEEEAPKGNADDAIAGAADDTTDNTTDATNKEPSSSTNMETSLSSSPTKEPSQKDEAVARSAQDLPEAAPLPPALPPTPPRPVNVARSSAPTEQDAKDLDAVVASSRSVFKPIATSPTDKEDIKTEIDTPANKGTSRAAPPTVLGDSLSQDSLFQDDEEDDDDDDYDDEQGYYNTQAIGQQRQQQDQEELEQDIEVPAESEQEIVVPPAPESADLQEEEKQQIEAPRSQEDHDRFVQETIAAQLMGVATPTTENRSPPRAMATDGLDMDVETTYMNSTEIMSHLHSAPSVSGDRSVKTTATYGTAGTNYTTSTRSRRPGAAKQRLTSQKTGESSTTAKKLMGWQESIQAAAAGIDREWDPIRGWLDYKESEDEKKSEDSIDIPVMPDVHHQEKAVQRQRGYIEEQAPRSVASRSAETRSTGSSSEAVADSVDESTTPATRMQRAPSSPPRAAAAVARKDAKSPARSRGWVSSNEAVADSVNGSTTPATRMQRAPSSPPRAAAAVARKDAKSPARSRGWVETMKEATSRIDTKGKRWDPDRGWIDENGNVTVEDRYQGGQYGQFESDTQDFGTIPIPPPQEELHSTPEPQAQPRDMPPSPSSSSEPTHEQPRDPSGQKPLHFLRKDPSGQLANQEVDYHSDHQSTDASMKSGTSGRYIQIGDSGSVSSYYYGKPSKQTANKDRGTKLESTPENPTEKAETESTSASGQSNKLLVDVKKEKVSQEDATMFPELPKGDRRSSGPVDLDELDDLENGSFEPAPSFSWDDDNPNPSNETTPVTQPRGHGWGSAPPSSGKSIGSRGMTNASESSVSTTAKTIPRLKAPKRDTSPIRGRGSSAKSSSPQSQASPADLVAGSTSPRRNEAVASSAGRSPSSQVRSQKKRSQPPPLESSQGFSKYEARPQIDRSLPQVSEATQYPTPPKQSGPSPPGAGPERHPIQADGSFGAGNDAKSTYTQESSPSVNSVKQLHDYWERRSNGEPLAPQSAEWKSFLSKKVRAENDAAEFQKRRGNTDDERDSLFDFGSEGAFPSTRRSNPLGASPRRHDEAGLRSLEEISNLSPIRTIHDDDDEEEDTPSEVSTGVAQGTTFLQRLQACAAPIMPKTKMGGQGGPGFDCNQMPMAHLAFMRNNPSVSPETTNNKTSRASRFAPPGLCGKADVISEEDDEETQATEEDKANESRQKNESRRSQSNPRTTRQSDDMGSVISDEQFGQKTAYLEAIAMKAAVSGSKKNRKSRSSSGSSEVSAEGGKHSESWQRFLDKKASTSADEKDGVSQAAEKYATGKVQEMMDSMSSRSRSNEFQGRPAEDSTGAFPSVGNTNRFKSEDKSQFKNESAKAAEDLASARVEAMMHAISSSRTLDEGEGEI